MKRILLSAAILIGVTAFVVLSTGASQQSSIGIYRIEFQNAFGLVSGADFKVAGTPAGAISDITLDKKTLDAIVTIDVTNPGFGSFHQDATCESRPQSLIGEYYVDCNPGSSGPVLKPGSTIPVSHTISTIPADLIQDIMRLPYRQRLTLIINELGAAAAARGGDLQAALQRAVPALTETDNLLQLLGNDSTTLQNLTHDSNQVVTDLANNNHQVNRFIDMANRTAVASATQDSNISQTWARLPALLSQLRPAMAKLRTTVVTNTPVLQNLNASAGELHTLFGNLPAFSRSSQPSLKSLGQASVIGKPAVIAARPTITDLNRFAKPTPELAGNLAIVLHDLDNPKRAVEPDARSPGGKGFTGLQALLGYAFNQALAINTYSQYGHVLAVDAFYDPKCSPYQSAASLALYLKQYGAAQRNCYAWLGPTQPGLNSRDPSNPNGPIPDPGGEPPGKVGHPVSSTTRQLTPQMVMAQDKAAKTPATSGPAVDLNKTIGQIISGSGTVHTANPPVTTNPTAVPTTSQAKALLNYLLAP